MRWFVLALALTGCAQANPNEITVGAYFSLSGPDTTFGTDSREAIDLAVDEVNAAGGVHGKPIHVVFEDDKSTTQEAALKVRQLIDRNKAVAILGEVASSRSLAGGLIANTHKVPMVTPSSTAVDVTRNRKWVFRACFTDELQGRAAARFVHGELGKKRVAIFFAAQDTYSSGLAKSFRVELQRLGGNIVIDKSYQKGETNFRTYVSELKSADPDMIFVPNYYNEMVQIARQAQEVGIAGSMFIGGDGWDSANLIEGGGSAIEGAYMTNSYAADFPSADTQRFLVAYRGRYHHDPTSLAALAYDGARLLFDAIGRTADAKPEQIRQALADTKSFTGATGTMRLDANRNAIKPVVVVQVRDRKFGYVTQMNAE